MPDTEDVTLEDDDEDAEVEEEEKADEEDEKDPPVRKSSAFFAQRRIIAKKDKEIEKLKAGKGEEKDEDIELTPGARSLIQKELQPVVDSLKSQSDEIELRGYLQDHPEHKKFEKAARKRIEAWTNVPIEDIFKTLTYGQAGKEKTEEKTKAIDKAKSNRLPGSSARATEPKLPTTQKEFKEIYDKVKSERTSVKLGE